MSVYKLIEDCSPFYVKFTFTGIEDIVRFVSQQPVNPDNCKTCKGYLHKNFTKDIGASVIKMLPMNDIFKFQIDRVSVFDTWPTGGCGVHKDGSHNKVSFNIPIEVHDDLCKTHWYSDELFQGVEVKGLPYTRNVYPDFTLMDKLTPIKTMVAQPNEMVIFNTDIFHSWYNLSPFHRQVLTLRTIDFDTLDFNTAVHRMF